MVLFDPKPGMSLDELRDRLVHAMTAYDRKMSANPRAHWSPYALGHYLKAIEGAVSESRDAADFPDAVMHNLLPAPWLRTWLRKLDPTIDVRRQTWTRGGEDVR